MKDDAGIDPIDDRPRAEHGDMNIEASLDERVGRIHRDALRAARPEMRDHENELLFSFFRRADVGSRRKRTTRHARCVIAVAPVQVSAQHGVPSAVCCRSAR